METYPLKLTMDVSGYYHGTRLIPPARYRDVVCRLVEYHRLRRTTADGPDAQMGAASSQMSVEARRDHNAAFVRVVEPGGDLREVVRARLWELCLHRVECIYVDLPLSHPVTRNADDSLKELGFFFGCIIPEVREGDVLRLQYLNNVEIKPDDVHTASDFGRELLETIFQEYKTKNP